MASDNLSVEQVNILLKGSNPAPTYCLKRYCQGEIENERQKLIPGNDASEGNFIIFCAQTHNLISDYPDGEANLEFFQNDELFLSYAGGHWRKNSKLESIWYQYYKISGGFFLQLGNFAEAERCFIKAAEIKVDRKAIITALNLKYKQDSQQKIPPSGEFGPFYERIRRAHGVKEFDAIDSQYLAFYYGLTPRPNENQLKHMGRALELPWPEREDPLYMTDKNSFKKDVPKIFYKFGKFKEAKDYLLTFPETALDAQHLKILATTFALEDNWDQSFEYFRRYWEMSKFGALTASPEEFVALLRMLETRSEIEMKNYGFPWLTHLLEPIPAGKRILRSVLPSKERSKQPNAVALQNILSNQILEDARRKFASFDSDYHRLWGHASALHEADMQRLLKTAQDIAAEIDKKLGALEDLFKTMDSVDLLMVKKLNERFLFQIELFYIERIKIDHEISRRRRELFQQSQGQSYFVESPWSMSCSSTKAEILSLHKKAADQAQQKATAKLSRTPQRKPCVGNSNEKPQEVLSAEHQSVCLFKDGKLKGLWESQLLPKPVSLALYELAEAKSIFHLRKMLVPGAKIELLKGDRKGQISIRVNDQFRLCFVWVSGLGAYDIELVDYHRQ